MSDVYGVVERNPRIYQGPGIWSFFKDEEILGTWSCITGHKELDPAKMGGLTPGCDDDMMWWLPIERLEKRWHEAKGRHQIMSRLVPCGEFSRFLARTTMVDQYCVPGRSAYPFMAHEGTRDEAEALTYESSTGCPAVTSDFEGYQKVYNELYDAGHRFPIYVRDT